MDDLLTPLSTTYKAAGKSGPAILKESAKLAQKERHDGFSSRTPEGAIDALKDQPDFSTLVAVLKYLTAGDGWNVRQASSQTSQIVSVLVTETAPNYWPVLMEDATTMTDGRIRVKAASALALFLQCLRSTTGINAILRLLDGQTYEARNGRGAGLDMLHGITSTLELLSAVLDGNDSVIEMLSGIVEDVEDRVKRRITMQELTNLLGGGKVVARVAEAQLVGGKSGKGGQIFWMADGKEYTAWLSRNIIIWIKTESTDEMLDIACNLLTKTFRLGYSGTPMFANSDMPCSD
jgi:telomere length regulation protein